MGAPFPPVPNTIRTRVQGTTPGEIWENVFYWTYTGTAPTTADLMSINGTLATQWAGQIAALSHPDVTLTQVMSTDIASTQGAEAITGPTIPGTRTGGMLPANTAMLASYTVPARWRGGHFRSYFLVGTDTDLQDPMHWTTAFVNECSTGFMTFFTGMVGAASGGTTISSHAAVRYHGKYLTNNGPPHFVLQTPIAYQVAPTSLITHAQLSTQKGRIGRRRK